MSVDASDLLEQVKLVGQPHRERGHAGLPDEGAGESAAARGRMRLDALVGGESWFTGDEAK
jgi:hypothetical protein